MIIAIVLVMMFGLMCAVYVTLSNDRVNYVESNGETNTKNEKRDQRKDNVNRLWLYNL